MVNSPAVPLLRPTLPGWDEVRDDLARVWMSPRLTAGEYCERLESAGAAWAEVPHAVAVSSCTSGLMLAVKALGLTGEVILPPFTFAATGLALLWNGVTPVFADVEEGTYTLGAAAAEAAVTERTSAILAVNVFGVSPDYAGLEELAARRGLALLFDSAQGLGSLNRGRPAGGSGRAEVFSLSPTKVVTAFEGGLVTTRDAGLCEKLRRMRDYGKAQDGADFDLCGLSARMSELHACAGWHSFRRMETSISARLTRIGWYRERLAGLPGITMQAIPPGQAPNGSYFTIFVSGDAALGRDALLDALGWRGIRTRRYFYPALHLQAVFAAHRGRFEGRLPVAERAALQGLTLPLYAHMPEDEVSRVCEAIWELLG